MSNTPPHLRDRGQCVTFASMSPAPADDAHHATGGSVVPFAPESVGATSATESETVMVPVRHRAGKRFNVRLSAAACDRLAFIHEQLHHRGLIDPFAPPSVSDLIGLALTVATERSVDWHRIQTSIQGSPKKAPARARAKRK
jgi:hypothetical protein